MDKKGVYAETAFDYFVKDCKATLKLIENEFSSSQRLLEVGGGIGFVYIWLKIRNLVSIEPSEMESCKMAKKFQPKSELTILTGSL